MGERLVQALDIVPRFGLRAIDIGELVFSASVGLVVALAIAVLLLRARPGLRHASRNLFLLLVGLALFGVVFDLLHSMAVGRGISGFGVPGDGSEMVVMSLIFAYVHALVPRLPRSIS